MATKPFDWPDYFTLADELSKRTEEHCQRTAVSRAYYYIFHLARQRIINNRFPISRQGDSHRQIWEKFENDPDPRCQKLYTIAKKIHDKLGNKLTTTSLIQRLKANFQPCLNLLKDSRRIWPTSTDGCRLTAAFKLNVGGVRRARRPIQALF